MSVGRLIEEIRALKRVLVPRDFLRAMSVLVTSVPSIVARRNLTALDEAMSRDVEIVYRGEKFVVPAGSIDRELAGTGDSATFGSVREMFGNDVYLRAFKPLRDVRAVLDLGSNRGFFTLIAAKVWDEAKVVSVEPTAAYNETFRIIAEANGLDRARIVRLNTFVGATDGDRAVSLAGLLNEQGLTRVDFVKCDIEGSEYAAFRHDAETLKRIGNLAMEVHSWCGSTPDLVAFLVSTGMTVMTTDQHGHIVGPQAALYVYASREGQLQPPFFREGIKVMSPYA